MIADFGGKSRKFGIGIHRCVILILRKLPPYSESVGWNDLFRLTLFVIRKEQTMDWKHLPWHLPLTDWLLGATVLFATTGTVILCRFLLQRWRKWRIQKFLDQRAALASPGAQKFTVYDKQLLTRRIRQSGNERLEKSFAFKGNADLYVAIGLFILVIVGLFFSIITRIK